MVVSGSSPRGRRQCSLKEPHALARISEEETLAACGEPPASMSERRQRSCSCRLIGVETFHHAQIFLQLEPMSSRAVALETRTLEAAVRTDAWGCFPVVCTRRNKGPLLGKSDVPMRRRDGRLLTLFGHSFIRHCPSVTLPTRYAAPSRGRPP